MEKEQFKKAIEILRQIEEVERQIKLTKYLLSRPIQQTKWSNDFRDGHVLIPEELHETIGKLVLSEYTNRLQDLNKELKNV